MTLTWTEFADAARACGWTTYVSTADHDGRPHVAVVAPALGEEGVVWFATRPGTRKLLNLRRNAGVAFHWPIGAQGAPGELWAHGRATIHEDADDRRRMWESGIMPYDLSAFFGSSDDENHLFVRVDIESATLLGPDFVKRRWHRG